MRGYSSRMLAAGVSRHTVAPMPEATRAEFESKVYDQTWMSKSSHASVTRFAVLALDAEHAKEIGGLRLEHMFGPGAVAEMLLVGNDEGPFASERVIGVLSYESTAECAERRRAWRERAVAS